MPYSWRPVQKTQIPGQVVALEARQADEIRQMTVLTFSLTLSLFGIEVPGHIVVRKVSKENGGFIGANPVIGQNVFKLFMSRSEASASKRNIRGFFRNTSSYEVNAGSKPVKASGCFVP